MKKIALFALILVGTLASAQEGPIISSAIIAIDRNNDVKEAKQYIDEAAQIIEAKPLTEVGEKDLAKFYFYKGKINYRVHVNSDEAIKSLDEKALDKALDGFTNLIEYEKAVDRDRYTEDAQEQLQYVANDFAKRGIAANEAGDFQQAYVDFMKTYEIKKSPAVGITDTAMLFNAAIMAQQAGNYEKALELNQQLLKMNYKGVTYMADNAETGEETVFPNRRMMDVSVKSGQFENPRAEGDVRPDIYSTVAALALNQKDTALFEETVQRGREMFPENAALMRSELQIFFQKKQYDKALENINQSVANAEGDDKVLMLYNKGVILQNEMERYSQALEAYKEALAIDSTYSDALYMSSIIYIDSANAVGQKMNELPLSANKEYEKLKAQQESIFKEALPYLEQAYATNPEDPQVVTALSQVYRALRMNEEFMKLKQETGQ